MNTASPILNGAGYLRCAIDNSSNNRLLLKLPTVTVATTPVGREGVCHKLSAAWVYPAFIDKKMCAVQWVKGN